MRKYPLQAILQFDDPQSGNAAANVEFNVYNSGGGLATIYANDGANPISQTSPLVTDSNGRYDFYVDNGRYSILFTDQVIAAQNDVLDIGIYEYGSAGARDVANTAEAIAGTSNKLPDTIGVKAFVDADLSARARGKRGKLLTNGDSTLLDSGDYYWDSAQGGINHPDNKTGIWHIQHIRRAVGGGETQVWTPENKTSGTRFYRIRVVEAWPAPIYIYDSDNLIHAQNLSGATVNSNATLSGANLNPTKPSTWRNVSGGDILNNGYGLWEIV